MTSGMARKKPNSAAAAAATKAHALDAAATRDYLRMEQESQATLILRRANVSRISGQWQDEDYDVFDGDRDVGRIYLVDGYGGREMLVLGRFVPGHRPQELWSRAVAR